MQTPFHAYYTARKLSSLSEQDRLVSVYAASNIKVYPFQIAAANFALRSPYPKGVVLCDESGMGKSHEAMLVVLQKWLEGKTRILIAIPNADLLGQWVALIEEFYTVPVAVLSRKELQGAQTAHSENPFITNAIVLTTYDTLAAYQTQAVQVQWDVTVFEEATALSGCYQAENKQGKALKEIANGSFKVLLTGTPIEKNIMDLYGLLYFIDETILPEEQTFLRRYLRRPERYPELAEKMSKFCFRTLRSQAAQYAKIPNRNHITVEYTPSQPEQTLYNALQTYIEKENKIAFPAMSSYDLALRLFGLLGSSTAALQQTLRGIETRLAQLPPEMPLLAIEQAEIAQMLHLAEQVTQDEKAKQLCLALPKLFALLKKAGAKQKAVVFTESVETQKYLAAILSEQYQILCYNGASDHTVIQAFENTGEVLISTDHGARGFNLQSCALIIHYDLLYNTLKMEQRIDRCHRLGQQHDVFVLSFLDQNNFADVRKLELVNKRTLVSNGVFGVSDAVIGGFTPQLETAIANYAKSIRTGVEIEKAYQQTLLQNQTENEVAVQNAEDVLFTTFTKEFAQRIAITPQYIAAKSGELEAQLWQLAKFFFERYNQTQTDCHFVIDEENKTITATNYDTLPTLLYYWTGTQNKQYKSLKQYGMAADFKPRQGRITLSSILGRGILHELACADTGTISIVDAAHPSCEIALYSVQLKPSEKEYAVLCGKASDGSLLTHEKCEEILALPVGAYTESEHTAPHWLRTESSRHSLDRLLDTQSLCEREQTALTPLQQEEIAKMQNGAVHAKAVLDHIVRDLEGQVKQAEQTLADVHGDRMQALVINRTLNQLRAQAKQKAQQQFFEEMQIDVALEQEIETFLGREKVTATAIRQFVVEVNNESRI